MSGFSIDWLDLREPADLAARDRALAQKAMAWLQDSPLSSEDNEKNTPVIVDLGAGTGSTLLAMAALACANGNNDVREEGSSLLSGKNADNDAGAWRWRLVDHDGALLDEARLRHADTFQIECFQADLTLVDELPLADACLVSASALFDLASEQFVDDLVCRLKQHHSGLYAALNYNGSTTWVPEHPLDGAVLAAFNRDQYRDKGLGPALGPEAAGYLRQTLEVAGFRVWEAPSPWRLGIEHAAMTRELISGITDAVAEGYGLDIEALAAWREFRIASVSGGSCTVGHTDLLALPVD